MTAFAAIDFETADQGRDSACSVAVVLVENGRITERLQRLIRPPRSRFLFTHIHGLRWEDCCEAPDFAGVWPDLAPLLARATLLVAHNAPFDKGVLHACCTAHRLPTPRHRFACTVQIARAAWGVYPTKLPDVCRHLRIALKHHDALSDASACAEIALAALRDGHKL
ncbi:3'-5' exonuclease [Azospirillum halopraeferens]|uniref:3'-5' exonuclease n=1 Tax=Azospirillum halopraeferens TaxID=34010 RepID=UPI00041BB7C2|nr:3'-5' exonuclease [Azospirillum halopraeferens]